MELNKEYKFKKISSGTYGSVYDILYTNMVLKVINVEDLSLIELDIMNRLKHPNIIECIDFFYVDFTGIIESYIKKVDYETYYYGILMKKAICDLYTFCNNKISEKILLNIIKQVKEGLKYLHNNNIIHMDIKPANILIFNSLDNPQIKICDFGISIYQNNNIGNDRILSTSGFRAPDKKFTIKCDYWSLGCTILNCCNIETYIDEKKDIFHSMNQQEINAFVNKKMKSYLNIKKFVKRCLTIESKCRNINLIRNIKNEINFDKSYNNYYYKVKDKLHPEQIYHIVYSYYCLGYIYPIKNIINILKITNGKIMI